MTIRVLSENDAAAYQTLRLRSLSEFPIAFGRSFEDESRIPLSVIERKLQNPSPESYSLGVFEEEELLGILSFFRYQGVKVEHRAIITNMYVVREKHGQGIGKSLLKKAIHNAHALSGLEELIIAVTTGNESARALYLSLGFSPICTEPRYIKWNGHYYDIEWMSLALT